MIKLEINNAEYIAQLEEARLSADNPYGYLFMDIIFSDPMFDESTFKMKDVRREPMRTYMTEDVARDLFEKLKTHFNHQNMVPTSKNIKNLM
ncbi:hypothetical protein GWI68_11850 [Proteus sp. G2669]|uniref:hypothetical protein n=1 Tax=Gammaproteobacteria TaxID=1236 RepID=UPI0006589BED|nr:MULTISPECIES: hypothetical protein [Gammaproteobacteria]NBM55447.1 hypothetical protein [Proteus sp. G2669]UDN37415.1 hypothetical protein LG402_07160 [Proteus sp. NMG38-2]CRL63817.1 hypothetical protein BN1805_02488 [Proteus vulgaris]